MKHAKALVFGALVASACTAVRPLQKPKPIPRDFYGFFLQDQNGGVALYPLGDTSCDTNKSGKLELSEGCGGYEIRLNHAEWGLDLTGIVGKDGTVQIAAQRSALEEPVAAALGSRRRYTLESFFAAGRSFVERAARDHPEKIRQDIIALEENFDDRRYGFEKILPGLVPAKGGQK